MRTCKFTFAELKTVHVIDRCLEEVLIGDTSNTKISSATWKGIEVWPWICKLGIAINVQYKNQATNVSMKVSAYYQVGY